MSYEGWFSYPGIDEPQYIRAAVRTNGLRPNKCLLVSKPQDHPPLLHGDLSFGFDATGVTWADALCDSALMQVTDGGQSVIWTILDGRWRHRKAFISGAYNVVQPDGTVDPDTEKTLQELATILFNAIGVSADVSAVDTIEKPEVTFDHDRVVTELEELLEQRGYVCSYQLDGSYKVYRVGTGAVMPNDGDVVNFANSINPPELPYKLRVVGDHTKVQSKFKTIPVGLDTDGQLKPVNDLSYKPLSGWLGFDLKTCIGIADPKARELCLLTVGRWFQVRHQADQLDNIQGGGVDYAPGEILVMSANQYLPLSEELLETAYDVYGKPQPGLAYVEATIFDDFGNPAKMENTPKFTRIDSRDWTLDKKMGIVKMFDLSLKSSTDDPLSKKTFADIYLTCSYSVDDPTTNLKDRFIRDRDMGGNGMDQVKSEDLERHLICRYGSDGITITSIDDNESSVISKAEKLLDNLVASYSTGIGNTILYRGIRDYNTDGVNLQIVWKAAPPGSKVPFSTFVAQNIECHPLCPQARDRKRQRYNERSNEWNTSRGKRKRNEKKGRRR